DGIAGFWRDARLCAAFPGFLLRLGGRRVRTQLAAAHRRRDRYRPVAQGLAAVRIRCVCASRHAHDRTVFRIAAQELTTPDGKYRWGASDLPLRVSRAVSRAAISRWFRIPPREIVFLHRRLGGVFVLLA